MLVLLSCGGGTFIKRHPPDSGFAIAKIGDVIYSTSDFRMDNGEQRIVYKYWKFVKSEKKSITLSYEENLDYIKLTPDLKEEKNYVIGKDFTIRIQDMILEIYEQAGSYMIYYIRSGR